ncbi:MAG: DMT family transporter [Desulfurella sp.]
MLPKISKENVIAYFYLALCIIFWAAIPVVSKKILIELNNIQMLFYSTSISFLVLFFVNVFQKKLTLLKQYSVKDYFNMFFLGFLGAYFCYLILYKAFSIAGAQEVFILAYTWPIMVIILGFLLLREQPTLKKIGAIIISFFGIIVIITNGHIENFNLTNLGGALLSLFYAFIFALFSVLGKKFKYDQTISAMIFFLSALILMIPTVFFLSTFKLPSISVWFWLFLNGFFINGITYIFWFKALKAPTHIVSNLLYLTPFLSLVYIHIFLDEKILFSSFIGLLIIAFGIILQSSKLN